MRAALRDGRGEGVLSLSHFVPCRQALPDWMDPHAHAFDPAWLNHAAAGKAVKFSRVAGSAALDRQLRALTADAPPREPPMPHVHVFGHSHRPKDFALGGVRYVHHPVAYEEERRHKRVPMPCMKLLWDASGPVPSEQGQVLRYWEQFGGSVG